MSCIDVKTHRAEKPAKSFFVGNTWFHATQRTSYFNLAIPSADGYPIVMSEPTFHLVTQRNDLCFSKRYGHQTNLPG